MPLRVVRALAGLDHSETIACNYFTEAIQSRSLDRQSLCLSSTPNHQLRPYRSKPATKRSPRIPPILPIPPTHCAVRALQAVTLHRRRRVLG